MMMIYPASRILCCAEAATTVNGAGVSATLLYKQHAAADRVVPGGIPLPTATRVRLRVKHNSSVRRAMRRGGLAILCLGTVVSFRCGKDLTPIERVATTVEESLIPGMSIDRAVVILDSLGFQHSPLSEPDSSIQAILRDVRREGVILTSVHILLEFDAEGRLTGHQLKEVYTGP